MKHLVIGASGFVGRYLVEHLVEAYPKADIHTIDRCPLATAGVKSWTCDIQDRSRFSEILQKIAPDRVYHLVGMAKTFKGIGMAEFFERNYLTLIYLLEELKRLDREIRVFFSSTVHVYGNQEGVITENAPLRPVGYYAFTKYLAERAIQSHLKEAKLLHFVIGRLYNCIGPRQPDGFVVADFCRRIARLPEGTDSTLKVGPLSTLRQFVDVRDAVQFFPALLEIPPKTRFEVFNIASPDRVKIKDILEQLLAFSGKSPQIVGSLSQFQNKFFGPQISIQRLEKAVSGGHFRPIGETLKDAYEWALEKREIS